MTETRRNYRNFSWIVGGVLILAFGLAWPLWKGESPRWIFIGIGAALAFVGTVAPALLRPLYKAWMAIGHVLGTINTFLLLHLIFYIILSPIALFLRIMGRRVVALEWEKVSSYRRASEAQSKERMREMF